MQSKAELAKEVNDATLAELPDQALVSINRFERKKNVALALEAYIELQGLVRQKSGQRVDSAAVNRLVFAGGFDPNNTENREYLDELVTRVKQAGLTYCLVLPDNLKPHIADSVQQCASPSAKADVWFVPSFSNAQRATLLGRSLAILYTPVNEHFGIVPIEAMGACRPVIACNSGGPLESVVHEKTGFHCAPEPKDWASAMHKLLCMSTERRDKMREDAYARAKEFGIAAFGDRLDTIVRQLAQDTARAKQE